MCQVKSKQLTHGPANRNLPSSFLETHPSQPMMMELPPGFQRLRGGGCGGGVRGLTWHMFFQRGQWCSPAGHVWAR